MSEPLEEGFLKIGNRSVDFTAFIGHGIFSEQFHRHLQVVLYSIPLFFIFEFKILPGIGNKNQKIQTDKNAEKQGKKVFLLH